MVPDVPQLLQENQLPRRQLLEEGVLDERAKWEGQYL